MEVFELIRTEEDEAEFRDFLIKFSNKKVGEKSMGKHKTLLFLVADWQTLGKKEKEKGGILKDLRESWVERCCQFFYFNESISSIIHLNEWCISSYRFMWSLEGCERDLGRKVLPKKREILHYLNED